MFTHVLASHDLQAVNGYNNTHHPKPFSFSELSASQLTPRQLERKQTQLKNVTS
jgi:hypothetical protein